MGTKTTRLEKREKIVAAYHRGKSSIEKVAKRYRISAPTLHRWLAQQRNTNSLAPRPQGGVRRLLLDDDDRAFLKQLVLTHPRMPRKEIVAALKEQRGKSVSFDVLARALKKMGLTKKRSSKSTLPRPKSSKNYELDQKSNKKYNISSKVRESRKQRRYPSDMTDGEWKIVKNIFTNKMGRPPTNDRRDIVDAVFYIARSGCQWDMLPKDFPNYKTVNSCFCRWKKKGIWKELCDTLRKKYRKEIGREEQPSTGSVDSQSTKTTEKGAQRL
jgi:putative transposase